MMMMLVIMIIFTVMIVMMMIGMVFSSIGEKDSVKQMHFTIHCIHCIALIKSVLGAYFGDVLVGMWWSKDFLSTQEVVFVCSKKVQPVQRPLRLATVSKIPPHLRNLPQTQMHMDTGHIRRVGWLK